MLRVDKVPLPERRKIRKAKVVQNLVKISGLVPIFRSFRRSTTVDCTGEVGEKARGIFGRSEVKS